MPTPIDPKRLPGLKKARGEFEDDAWASQKQLAEIYGVTNARMTTLIKNRFPDFPEPQRHEDKTHWYPARAAITSMIAYMENAGRAKQAAARRHSAVMGRVTAAKEEAAADEQNQPPPLTAGDLDRLASAQTKIWKLKRDQGLYTLTSEVKRIARGVNSMLTREVTNLVYVIDPNGDLPPGKREAVIRKCRDIVLKMHDMLGEFLEENEDAGRAPGAAVARAGADIDHQRRRSGRRNQNLGATA